MTLDRFMQKLKGGTGSGNFGHSGIPGKRGGSAPGSGGGLSSSTLELMSDINLPFDKKLQKNLYKELGEQGVFSKMEKTGKGTYETSVPEGKFTLHLTSGVEPKMIKGSRLSSGNRSYAFADLSFTNNEGKTKLKKIPIYQKSITSSGYGNTKPAKEAVISHMKKNYGIELDYIKSF